MSDLSLQDTLINSGIESHQARAMVHVLRESQQELVTRADLRELELRIKLHSWMNAAAIIGVLSAIKFWG